MIDLQPVKDLLAGPTSASAQDRYRLLFEPARDIVLFLLPDGTLVDANPTAVATYGYDRDALLSMNVADLRAPEAISTLAAHLRQAGEGGIVFETQHRRRDGSFFPVEVNSHPLAVGSERLLMSVVRHLAAAANRGAPPRHRGEAAGIVRRGGDRHRLGRGRPDHRGERCISGARRPRPE